MSYMFKTGSWTVQFSSAAQLCPILCDPMNCSSPGLPVHHQLLEFTQTYVRLVGDAIQPFHLLLSPSLPAFNLSQSQASGSFQMSQLFAWGGQSVGVSASTSVLPMNTQDWSTAFKFSALNSILLKNRSSEKESPYWSLNWNFLFLECQKETLFSGKGFYKS